jgi:hypothetical protein
MNSRVFDWSWQLLEASLIATSSRPAMHNYRPLDRLSILLPFCILDSVNSCMREAVFEEHLPIGTECVHIPPALCRL